MGFITKRVTVGDIRLYPRRERHVVTCVKQPARGMHAARARHDALCHCAKFVIDSEFVR
jgi:hypothetical protein